MLGVRTLNTFTEDEFKNKLFEYTKYVGKVKVDDKELHWKYDINNGIFSLLQMNDNLSSDKYELINKMRENLWFNDEENYIDDEKLEIVIKH